MSDTVFERMAADIKALEVDKYADNLPGFINAEGMSPEQLDAISKVFRFLHEQKADSIRTFLLQTSRLPQKVPKTFEGFDFGNGRGKQASSYEKPEKMKL